MIPFFNSFSFANPVTYLDSPPPIRINVMPQQLRVKTITAWFHRYSYRSTPPPTCALPTMIVQLRSKCRTGDWETSSYKKRYQPSDPSVLYRFPCHSRSSDTSVDEYSSTTSPNAMQYWMGWQCLDDLRLHPTAIDFKAVLVQYCDHPAPAFFLVIIHRICLLSRSRHTTLGTSIFRREGQGDGKFFKCASNG